MKARSIIRRIWDLFRGVLSLGNTELEDLKEDRYREITVAGITFSAYRFTKDLYIKDVIEQLVGVRMKDNFRLWRELRKLGYVVDEGFYREYIEPGVTGLELNPYPSLFFFVENEEEIGMIVYEKGYRASIRSVWGIDSFHKFPRGTYVFIPMRSCY